MRYLLATLALVLGFLLPSCGSVVDSSGASVSTAPVTFNQKLDAGYLTVDGIAKLAMTMQASGQLNNLQVQKVSQQLVTAINSLDAIKMMYGTNPVGASNQLVVILAALTALQTALQTSGAIPTIPVIPLPPSPGASA